MSSWTDLGHELSSSQSMTPVEGHYHGQASFQPNPGFLPMNMMSPSYQPVPGTPAPAFSVPQGYDTGTTPQAMMEAMGQSMNPPNAMRMNFCSSCGQRWPCGRCP